MFSAPVSSPHFHCKVHFLMSSDMVPLNPLIQHVESTNPPTKSSVLFKMQVVHMLIMIIDPEYESMVILLE